MRCCHSGIVVEHYASIEVKGSRQEDKDIRRKEKRII
jgi:hypothetical protein